MNARDKTMVELERDHDHCLSSAIEFCNRTRTTNQDDILELLMRERARSREERAAYDRAVSKLLAAWTSGHVHLLEHLAPFLARVRDHRGALGLL